MIYVKMIVLGLSHVRRNYVTETRLKQGFSDPKNRVNIGLYSETL